MSYYISVKDWDMQVDGDVFLTVEHYYASSTGTISLDPRCEVITDRAHSDAPPAWKWRYHAGPLASLAFLVNMVAHTYAVHASHQHAVERIKSCEDLLYTFYCPRDGTLPLVHSLGDIVAQLANKCRRSILMD